MREIIKKTHYYIERPSKIKEHTKPSTNYDIQSVLCVFSINNRFEKIVTTLITSEKRYHSDKLNEDDLNYLKNDIILGLYSYGFSYSQIHDLLLMSISKKTISVWINNRNRDIRRKLVQYKFSLKIKKEDLKNKDEKNVKELIKKLLSTEIEIFSFDGKKRYELFEAKKIKAETRKKILKTTLSPNGDNEPNGE